MSDAGDQLWTWIWPRVGPTPINQGLDSEMFDRTDYPYIETFVREAIQNSLDARLDDTRPVMVNFTFHEGSASGRRAFLEPVLAFRDKAGLDLPEEWFDDRVSWLVVEDFNSKGLSGDLTKRTSDFWNYWLNFGLSNKDGKGRGGRGIGRVTFLIASRLQSVIGYTRRHADGQHAVCGMAVLRAGQDGDDFLSTHAYLAAAENGSIYDLHAGDAFRTKTRDAFGFTGYDGEYASGLGLAIPYPYPDLVPDGILAAAIENFAPAIMNGTLILNVDGRRLDAGSIAEIATDVSEHLNDAAIGEDAGRWLRLIRLGLSETSPHTVLLKDTLKSDLAALHKSAQIGKFQKKLTEDEEPVVLDLVFPLVRNGRSSGVTLRAVIGPTPHGFRPLDRLFREGMSLPDVRSKNPGQLDLILLVSPGELATYLNFCEGKAHLDLLESTDVKQKLAGQGFDGVRVKRFVKTMPTELRLLFSPEITEPDAHVFDTFFSIPSDKPGRKKKPKDNPDPPEPPPPPKPPVFKVDALTDGLCIRANPDFEDWPVNLTVTLAYADGTRRPSWSEYDFRLDDLKLEYEDCDIETTKNRVKALNCGPDCRIEITGFDTNRELDTSIRPWRHAQEN
ncbi:hypothetical protein [Rhodovulum sulfidophilum]|uniref:hypothetical protein n=1 Tax=Rhodovulum sulfidophilum TaxID=35806 RepID=UPI0019245287|nr:hypothetical protein [Rhodovulum sulfidophilum]MBL3560241.1 hypothetical protein [Rhodovulum sulfidophilum]